MDAHDDEDAERVSTIQDHSATSADKADVLVVSAKPPAGSRIGLFCCLGLHFTSVTCFG